MKKYILFSSAVILGLIFCSDPSGGSGPDKPDPLRMVKKTEQSDTTLSETGIDAVPENDAIALVWHPYAGINKLKKFKIYRSTDPDKNFNPYNEIAIENNFDQDTTFSDNNVNLYTDYYYFVTVVDEDNQESFPSDTVHYQLLEKAIATEPNGINYVPGETIPFRFFIPIGTNANGYIIRIERQIGLANIELVYIEYVNPRPDFGVENVLREISTTNFRELSNPAEYRWRVDVIAGDIRSEGSESRWANFTVNWGN